MKKSKRKSGLNRKLIAVGVAACFAADLALANPSGPAVVNGTVSFQRTGNLLQVTNSPNAIINWQSFSIGAAEITRFLQQSTSSAVLNRVITQNPSSILGALQSNGRVFLINPNGILFGAGAQIDVAGLVASTLNLSDADFLAGKLKFTEVPGAGSVVNQGTINAAQGGQVYLVGPSVTNSGVITSPKGEVILAAGNTVELVNPGTPNLRVEISAPDNQALNMGQIVADSGRVGIYAGLINHSGTIQANSAQVTEDGRIVLKATRNATLEAGSVTAANGAKGGSVTVQSGDTTLVYGTIEAKGSEGAGGTVHVLGDLVGLIDSARINVSGDTGGGTVLVGGDFQGKNPEVQNAFRTYVGPNTTISADALTTGDGGKVIVWSDDATRFYGNVSARGGAQSGNGGFVEVSGKEYLSFNGSVDVGAASGRAGTILLDPRDIIIQDTGGANNGEVTPITDESIFFADGGGATDFTLNDEALEALNGNIVLQAQRDITVSNGLSGGGLNFGNQTAGERVVFQAGRNITIDSVLTTAGAAIILEADSPHAGVLDGFGLVTINAAVNSGAGAIALIGGGDQFQGGFRLNADVTAGTGGINLTLTNSGTLDFGIGAVGNTQLSSKDTDHLRTTGPLVIGQATTAGSDGLGTGAQTLTVNSITNSTATPIELSPASGTSFSLIAGAGGITLGRPLTTFQETFITTTGTLTINDTLATSNNNLTITASSIAGTGSINVGNGGCLFNGLAACPGVSNNVFWDGGAGTLNWFDAQNWSGDFVPNSTHDVTIASSTGTIVINGAAEADNLIASRPVDLAGGSLTLASGSQFSDTFTLSGGSLAGAGSVTIGGSGGSLNWSAGSMNSGGTFFLSSGHSGTVNGVVTLDRLFENQGTLTLSSATISTTAAGSITNVGTMSVSNSTLSVPILNSSPVQFTGGTNIITAGAGITNGAVGFLGGTTTFEATSTYNVDTTNINGGTANFDTAASTTTLNLSGGTLGGSDNFSVSGLFNWTGGAISGSGVNTFTTNGTSTLSTGNTKTLTSRNWVNSGTGTVDWTAGSINLSNAQAVITNQGTFNVQNGSTGDDISGVGTFNNAGNFVVNSAAGDSTIFGPSFNNTGAVTVTNGLFNLFGAGTDTGSYTVAAGEVLEFAGGTRNLNAGASVSGAGTVRFSSPFGTQVTNLNAGSSYSASLTELTGGTVNVNGALNPGGSGAIGTMNVQGNFVLGPSAVVNIELAGVNPGEFDVLVISGAATLDGTLNVSEINGFGVTTGQSFPVVTYGGLTGAFATISSPAGVSMTSTFNPTNLTLDVNSIANTWIGTTGSWNNPLLWNRGHVPTSTEDVVIPDVGVPGVSDTITMSSGAQSVRSLTSVENLTLMSGSLDLGANSSMGAGSTLTVGAGAALNLGGGLTLSGPGSLVNQGTLALNSSTIGTGLNNQGTINVTGASAANGTVLDMNAGMLDIGAGATLTKNGGAFNWNGGALSGSGNLMMAGGATFNVTGSGARALNGLTLGLNNLSLNGGSLTLQSGTLNASGTTTIASGATMTAQGGTLNAMGSTIDIGGIFEAAGGTVNAGTMNVQAGGTLRGAGMVTADVNNMAGTVAPGTSPGILTINGNYVQGPGGVLAVEIGGTAPGAQHDQLMVTGNATLDGTLSATLVNGFVPSGSEAFTVIQTGGTVTGTFATTNLPSMPSFSTDYLVASVNLTTGGAPVAPPSAIESTVQTVVAAAEQSTTSQATTPSDPREEEEKRETQEKPVCTGGSSGGGAAAAAARPVVSGGGGGRCTARGCF